MTSSIMIGIMLNIAIDVERGTGESSSTII